MKKLLYLLLLFPIFLTAQPRYGVEGIPMCWTISGIDSNITRYVLISSTGSPTQTIAWENAAGQVINVTGGYLRYGYCDCAGGGGGGNGIYGGSGTLPAALVQVQNTNGIKFVEPGTQNGILIANKPNGAAAIALDPTYTDSIRNGLVWKQGADSAAIGIDKDGKLQLLSNDWVTIGNDQAKIIITKDDAVILIKTEGGGVYALPDAVPLSGKNNIMLYPNGSPLGRFANLDSLVDGRLRKDTTVVVLSENKVVDFDFADTRRYSNVYFVGKGVTDTAQLIFLNPPNSDQFGTVFHMKADSGGVAVKFNASQGANNKNGYFLQPGQRAEIRALYDAVAGFELWEVVILWDSIVRDKSIYTDNGTLTGNRVVLGNGNSIRFGVLYSSDMPSILLYANSISMGFGSGAARPEVIMSPSQIRLLSIYGSYNNTGLTLNSSRAQLSYYNDDNLDESYLENDADGVRLTGELSGPFRTYDYRLPTNNPSSTSNVYSVAAWLGTGSGYTASMARIESIITGTARSIPYMNSSGRYYAGNTYFKLDTTTTSGAMARVRLLINNPTGLAGEGDSYSALSVAAGDATTSMSILNMGDQALTNASVGYNSVMQLYRSGGTFSAKTNLANGNTVGQFAWRGQANNGSRALGHIGLDYTGDGTSINSSVYGSSAVSGTVVKGWLLDNQSRFWLGSGADDYYMPTTAPISATGSKSALEYEGTGSSTVPKWMPKRYGAATTSTDANGDIVVTFGAAMPDATYLAFVSFVSPDNTGLNYSYSVHSVTSAGLKIRVMNASTSAAVSSTSVTYNLKVEDY